MFVQFWLTTNVAPTAVQLAAGGHDTEYTPVLSTVPVTWIASPQLPFTSLTTKGSGLAPWRDGHMTINSH